jgi:hypothetical protein
MENQVWQTRVRTVSNRAWNMCSAAQPVLFVYARLQGTRQGQNNTLVFINTAMITSAQLHRACCSNICKLQQPGHSSTNCSSITAHPPHPTDTCQTMLLGNWTLLMLVSVLMLAGSGFCSKATAAACGAAVTSAAACSSTPAPRLLQPGVQSLAGSSSSVHTQRQRVDVLSR